MKFFVNKRVSLCPLTAILVLAMIPVTSHAGTVLNLTARVDSEAGKLGEKILREAYKKLDTKVKVRRLPGNRAIYEANNGESNGEVVRLKKVLEKYKNLRLVPESLVHIDAVIASKNTDIIVEGWKTVKKFSAATVMGYRSIQKRIKDQPHVYASSVESALKVLKGDRVDILILSRFDMIKGLQKTGFKDIVILDPPVSRVPLYHMLHKSKESLIPKITKVLKDMKMDGSHQRLVESFIANLGKGEKIN